MVQFYCKKIQQPIILTIVNMNMFEDFIGTFENSIPIEMCNEIAEWFDYCSDKNFTEGNIGTAEETKWRGKRERADETIIIPTFVSSKSFPEELSNAFWGVLNNCFHEYYEKYYSHRI